MSDKLDALKVLHDGILGDLRALSNRSFTTTLQTLTLNVAIVAALAGSNVVMSYQGKKIGTLLLFTFNATVVCYLTFKALSHYRIKTQFIYIQSRLLKESGLNDDIKVDPFWKSFFRGSLLFIIGVLIAGACSIAALWVSLVQQC